MDRRRWILVGSVLVAVSAVAGGIGYFALTRSGPFAPGTVDFDLCGGTLAATFQYVGNSSGFLSDGYGLVPGYCEGYALAPGGTLAVGLFVHSSDPGTSHALLHVSLLGPFSLRGLAPGLPTEVAHGGNVSFTVTVGLPGTPGTYPGPTAVVTAD